MELSSNKLLLSRLCLVCLCLVLPKGLAGQELWAGQEAKVELFGKTIELPARDRRESLAFSLILLGTSPTLYQPNPAGGGAFYWSSWKSPWHIRTVLAGAFNEFFLEVEGVGPVVTFETSTLPWDAGEYWDGIEIQESQIYSGYFRGGIGVGWLKKLSQRMVENHLSLALIYELGFHYYKYSENTPDEYLPPPTHWENSVHLRFRIDNFKRNLLEMRQVGWALGGDAYVRIRNRWYRYGWRRSEEFVPSFAAIKGFFHVAFPLFHYRHVAIFSLFGGILNRRPDRFSTFAIGGSSSADEYESLARPILWGAHWGEFPARGYGLATVEYRFQVLFFLFLHFRASLAYLSQRLGPLTSPTYRRRTYPSVSMGITSGFLWNSVLVLDYGYSFRITRRGKKGSHAIVFRWSFGL